MKRLLFLATALCALASAASAAIDPNDVAKARLEKTPRHLEWVTIKQGDRNLKSFIGFPEVKGKATAVVLIHDIYGMSDWHRGMVDQFAEAGYIVIAPDFLSGMGPNGGGTESFGGGDGVRTKITSLDQKQLDADLTAAVNYAKKLDACNGKVVVGGFCWGGGKTFLYSTVNPDIKASLVFYGAAAKAEDMPKINAPVYGFYGGNDARINTGIPAATEAMKAAGKKYDPVIYDGAGHGFMKAGEPSDGSPENRKAREDAWKRIKEI